MGLDYRDWTEGAGYPRTDSMMLATIDPVARTGAMLSIPRDLFVEIPNAGYVHTGSMQLIRLASSSVFRAVARS